MGKGDEMKIGLDLDGVIYQFSKTAQYMLARKKGLMCREDLKWDYTLWDHGLSKEDWDWVLSPPQADKVFRYGHLFSGAIEFVHELSLLGSVIIITKRPFYGVQATLDFLAYMKFPLTALHIIDEQVRKSSIPCDAYIDDSPINALDYYKETKSLVILIDRPWNSTDKLPSSIKRVFFFEEAIDLIKIWKKNV